MTLDDLTVNFNHLDAAVLLEDWDWLIGANKLPILITRAGDAFVQDATDFTVHFLSANEGTVEEIADSTEAFKTLLADKAFVFHFFSFDVVAPMIRAGTAPGPGEVVSLEIPMALGGDQSPSNLGALDMAVHFSLLGQMFEQIHDLPPGTPMTGFKVAG